MRTVSYSERVEGNDDVTLFRQILPHAVPTVASYFQVVIPLAIRSSGNADKHSAFGSRTLLRWSEYPASHTFLRSSTHNIEHHINWAHCHAILLDGRRSFVAVS